MSIWVALKGLKKSCQLKKELGIGKKISDKELTGKKICDKIKTIKDYHDLHIKCDVLLLADVFEKIGDNSLTSYGLFLSHYLK